MVHQPTYGDLTWPNSFPACEAEILAEVRREFNTTRGITDLEKVKFLLSDGRQRLKLVRDMLGLQA